MLPPLGKTVGEKYADGPRRVPFGMRGEDSRAAGLKTACFSNLGYHGFPDLKIETRETHRWYNFKRSEN
jgi:hypothetical protein